MPEIGCWVCESRRLRKVRESSLSGDPDGTDLRITDSRHGRTCSIYRCEDCGFMECPEVGDPTPQYASMEDADYEGSRSARALQARRLLATFCGRESSGGRRLLDIGAGSGILVEEAARMGFDAEGIEPSEWLAQRAASRGLRVPHGIIPHPDIVGPFDVITIIDVIEHVADPVGLLRQARELLAEGGRGLVVTPDVGSLMARLLGWRWWHFRVAHIGYFDASTLRRSFAAAGLRLVKLRRPWWFFPGDYLADRMVTFLPVRMRPPIAHGLSRVTVPLNLLDSWAAHFVRA